MKIFNQPNCRLVNFAFYFAIYSFVGWCMETAYAFLTKGEFINRGFLFGPFCPIYGFGALLLIIFLKPVKHNIFLTFTGSVVLTSVLEYITGLLLEIAFNKTWWDYSSEPLNLNGRICLRNSLLWGMISLIFIYVLHPVIKRSIYCIPIAPKASAAYLLVFYLLFDTIIVTFSLTMENPDVNLLYRIYEDIHSGLNHIRAIITK